MGIIKQAKRMDEVPLSGIRDILNYANKLEREGKEIVHLDLGMPDFDTPEHIKEGAIKALREGKVHYPPITGIPELTKAICNKLETENGLHYAPDEVIVGIGVAQGMLASILCFLNEGEEILIPDPGYLSYMYIPKMAGGIIKTYSLKEENDYQIDFEEFESQITDKTKIIVLISPNNPTGSLLYKDVLEKIARIAIEKNLLVISDEVYERLVYDGEFVSIASIPGMKERTIILNGFSKYYSMTGWRLGYIVSSKELIDPMMRFCFYNTTSAVSFVQWGALEALNQSNDPSEKMRYEYARRRDFLVAALNKMNKVSCKVPEGAFYIFLNIKDTGLSSDQCARYLLDKAGVATVPGNVFGENGEGYLRLSYANSYENLVKAAERLEEAFGEL